MVCKGETFPASDNPYRIPYASSRVVVINCRPNKMASVAPAAVAGPLPAVRAAGTQTLLAHYTAASCPHSHVPSYPILTLCAAHPTVQLVAVDVLLVAVRVDQRALAGVGGAAHPAAELVGAAQLVQRVCGTARNDSGRWVERGDTGAAKAALRCGRGTT